MPAVNPDPKTLSQPETRNPERSLKTERKKEVVYHIRVTKVKGTVLAAPEPQDCVQTSRPLGKLIRALRCDFLARGPYSEEEARATVARLLHVMESNPAELETMFDDSMQQVTSSETQHNGGPLQLFLDQENGFLRLISGFALRGAAEDGKQRRNALD